MKVKVKRNELVRAAIKANKLYHWQVAEQIGISEYTFVHWLRKELPDERKELVMKAIAELSTR